MLLNVGTKDASSHPVLKEGEHEVSREDGLQLIERGWAIPIESPAATVKAVPAEPAINSEESGEVKPTRAEPPRANKSKSSANKEQ